MFAMRCLAQDAPQSSDKRHRPSAKMEPTKRNHPLIWQSTSVPQVSLAIRWRKRKEIQKCKKTLSNSLFCDMFCVLFNVPAGEAHWQSRSEERRVGIECGSTCRSRWSP